MTKADEPEALNTELVRAIATFYLSPAAADVVIQCLDAIDAQQSIIDEQQAEIERLTKDAEQLRELIKRGLDVCDPRCDGDVEWMDDAIAAISPAELTPADVCGTE